MAQTERERENGRLFRMRHPERIRAKTVAYEPAAYAKHLGAKYGLTVAEYDELLAAQGGGCAICGKPHSGCRKKDGGYKKLSVDHDHKTGKIRGLLCNKCNGDIGWIESAGTNGKEELLREYLRKFS